ncbi:MAG: hypothetical protein LUG51_15550 [Tannerellaceae bacterium]|nr:hypothetical protein [Tannerellaceae bacterium]
MSIQPEFTLTEVNKFIKDICSREFLLYNESVLIGYAGTSLFYYEISKIIKNSQEDIAFYYLEKALEKFDKRIYIPTYCSGVAGFSWGVHYLVSRNFIDPSNEEMLDCFDEYLEEAFLMYLQEKNYDFLHGSTGILYYYLQRENVPLKDKLISQYLDSLQVAAIYTDKDTFYWNHKEKEGLFPDISLSHGMSAIVILLTKIAKDEAFRPACEFLITGAVNYILTQELEGEYSLYPHSSLVRKNRKDSYLGWCHGDLGVGLALYYAGKMMDNQAWIEKSNSIFYHSFNRRSVEERGMNNGFICHGAAGVALIYYRMYLNTENERFYQEALYWIKEAVALYTDPENEFEEDDNLLTGSPGIALTLACIYYKVDPAWDTIFLIS